MARAIDASHFGEIMEQWKKDCLECDDQHGADVIIDVILQLDDMPTLTQPNEPLTWEELKQMAGEPVYIVEPKKSISSAYWVLIDEVDEKSMWCVVGIGSACLNFYKTYGKTWMAYRRPPDEAVDMVMERLEEMHADRDT